MAREKGISTLVGLIIIIVVAVVVFGGVFGYQYLTQPNPNTQNIVGGERDENGCIGSAGYSWCEAKQKCLRSWEEPCQTDATAGWKTYTNNEFGFSVKYPQGYSAEEFNGAVRFAKNNDETVWNGFEIKLINLKADESCDSEKYAKSILMAGDSNYSKTYLVGINQNIEQVKNKYGNLTPTYFTFIPMENCGTSKKMVRISGSETYISEYNVFISTFKFTK